MSDIKGRGELLFERDALVASMRVILEGFDRGIFVRSIDDDANAAWAIKLFPYIKALADGQAAITKADQS